MKTTLLGFLASACLVLSAGAALVPSGDFTPNKPGSTTVTATYTVSFSEPMIASTVDASDFGNTGATAMSVDSVTPTANSAVFLVGVKPTVSGTCRLERHGAVCGYQNNQRQQS